MTKAAAPADRTSGRAMWMVAALGFTAAAAFALGARSHTPAATVEAEGAVGALPAVRSARPPLPEVEPAHAVPAPPRDESPAPPNVAPPEAPPAAEAVAPDDSIQQAEAYVAAARARREAERRGQAAASVEVIMYSTSWCGYCRRARAWLGSRGIRYVEHDIERESDAREHMRTINPRGGVPTFEVDQQVLTGFSAPQLEQAIAFAAQRRANR